MKIQFQSSIDVRNAVQRVSSVVDKKITIPVLANILLETVSPEWVRLTANNLELGMSTAIPAIHADDGSITIPAQKFAELLREFPDAPLTLDVDEQYWNTLTCGKAKVRLAGLPKTDFPDVPAFPAGEQTVIPGGDLKTVIEQTLYAVSHDESRYALTGVLWDMTETALSLIATDGHRLACTRVDVEHDTQRQVIIPAKAMVELKKLCALGDVAIHIGEQHLSARVDTTELVSRLIDAQFPDYRQVLPTESRVRIPLDKDALTRALRRVALLTSDTRLIKFAFAAETLVLSANDPNLGEAEETVATPFSGEPITIGLNARYVQDMLSTIPGETVMVSLNDALSPVLWTVPERDDFQSVIMPMRV